MKFTIVDNSKKGYARHLPSIANAFDRINVLIEQMQTNKIKKLTVKLENGDAYVRKQTAWFLGKIAGKKGDVGCAIPVLANVLLNDTKYVAENAARALGNAAANEKNKDAAMDALINASKHSRKDYAIWALAIAVEKGADISCAIPILADALLDRNEKIVENAAWALTCASEKGLDISYAIPALIVALHRGDNAFKIVCDALGNAAVNEKSRHTTNAAIIDALKYNSSNRLVFAFKNAIEKGADIGAAFPVLIELSKDNNYSVVYNTAEALGYAARNDKSRDSAIDALTGMLKKGSNMAKSPATRALKNAARNGVDIIEAIPALTQALNDENGEVRRNAIEALAAAALNDKTGDSAIDALADAFKHKSLGAIEHAMWLIDFFIDKDTPKTTKAVTIAVNGTLHSNWFMKECTKNSPLFEDIVTKCATIMDAVKEAEIKEMKMVKQV